MTEISDAMFEESVLSSKKPVLLYFWAPTCKPCHMMKPELEEIVAELSDQLEFTHTDAVANDEICQKTGVMSTPTVIMFYNGEPVMRIIGYVTKEDLRNQIKTQLKQLA